MVSKREAFASFGIASKGIVYIIVSALTLFSALNMGGQKSSSKEALEYLAKQDFGIILLSVISVGLAGYVFFRFYQTFYSPDSDSKTSFIKRIGYFLSGLMYAFLCYSAIKMILGGSTSSESSKSNFISQSASTWLTYILAIGLFLKGVYDIYKAYSHKYKEDIKNTELDPGTQSKLLKWGRFGVTARGSVFLLMGYLTIKSEGSLISGKTDVFSYVSNEFGQIALIVLTLGLLGYGVFMLVKARYASNLVSYG